jgi:hypothetical protein
MPISIANNPVERVVAALRDQQLPDGGFTLPVEVIRDASEKYRLLATRIPVGSIVLQPASQKDTAERRAAALLEYCSRRRNAQNRLTWKAVAAAVHAKSPAALQQLQHILISFLQPVVVSRQKGSNIQVTSQVLNGKNTASHSSSRGISLRQRIHPVNYKDSALSTANITTNDSSSTGLRYVPRILPELVIRLAGHLVDPNGTQKLACQLLNDIYSYYDRPVDASSAVDGSSYSNAAERRGHLYDLQRYAAAYEAAALYHVATTAMDGNRERGSTRKSLGNGRVTKKPKGRNTAKKQKDEALNTEDDDNDVIDPTLDDNDAHLNAPDDELPILRGLQIDDLVEASSEFTYLEVKQVLPRVQTLAKKLLDRSKSKEAPGGNGRSKTAVGSQEDTDHGSNKRKRRKAMEEDILPSKEEDATGDASGTFDPMPSFAEWKERIWTSIRSTAPAEDASIDVIWSLAADQVLRKHGLL